MDIHGSLQTRGETRCPGGVSVSYLASRTRHKCPRYNEILYMKAWHWIWTNTIYEVSQKSNKIFSIQRRLFRRGVRVTFELSNLVFFLWILLVYRRDRLRREAVVNVFLPSFGWDFVRPACVVIDSKDLWTLRPYRPLFAMLSFFLWGTEIA